jgi:hypothetical protein
MLNLHPYQDYTHTCTFFMVGGKGGGMEQAWPHGSGILFYFFTAGMQQCQARGRYRYSQFIKGQLPPYLRMLPSSAYDAELRFILIDIQMYSTCIPYRHVWRAVYAGLCPIQAPYD